MILNLSYVGHVVDNLELALDRILTNPGYYSIKRSQNLGTILDVSASEPEKIRDFFTSCGMAGSKGRLQIGEQTIELAKNEDGFSEVSSLKLCYDHVLVERESTDKEELANLRFVRDTRIEVPVLKYFLAQLRSLDEEQVAFLKENPTFGRKRLGLVVDDVFSIVNRYGEHNFLKRKGQVFLNEKGMLSAAPRFELTGGLVVELMQYFN